MSERPPEVDREDGYTYAFCMAKGHYVPKACFGRDRAGDINEECLACAGKKKH